MTKALVIVVASFVATAAEIAVVNYLEKKEVLFKKRMLNKRLKNVVYGGIDEDYIPEDNDIVEILYNYRKMPEEYRTKVSIEEFIQNYK